MSIAGACPFLPDQMDDAVCQYTYTNVTCPVGYYCPNYDSTSLQVESIRFDLEQENCQYGQSVTSITGSDQGLVVCPCAPGYFCPPNSALPVVCQEGFYCPSDTNIKFNVFNETIGNDNRGIGTWGTMSKICPKGKWCAYAQVQPFDCRNDDGDSPCGVGSTHPHNRTGLRVFLIVLILVMYVWFVIRDHLSKKYREYAKHAVEAMDSENVDDDENDQLLEEIKSYEASSITGLEKSKDEEAGGTRVQSSMDHATFDIEFEDLELTLKSGVTVMKGVSGKWRAGRMCAVMGPSGAGKTTVISLVTGKAVKTGGLVMLNGQPAENLSHVSKLVGFVPQEDTMIRSATVRDTLKFSAQYRLPYALSANEIEEKVNHCLVDLGISHVQFSAIGDEYTRGVSGGQRKRVNIGIELIAEPRILILDEPTSGLDSTSATALCMMLKDLVLKKQMTLISVIHQPSIGAFEQFDDLLLLGKGGQVIYMGPLDECKAYFAKIGFPYPEGKGINPSDFYIDVASGAVEQNGNPHFQKEHLFTYWKQHKNGEEITLQLFSTKNDGSSVKKTKKNANLSLKENVTEQLHDFGEAIITISSNFYWRSLDYLTELQVMFFGIFKQCAPDPIRLTPGPGTQLFLCFNRGLKQNLTGFSSFLKEGIIQFLIGLIVASSADLIFIPPLPNSVCNLQADPLQKACRTPTSDFQNAAVFVAFGIIFVSIAMGSTTFGKEQPNYWRECSSGMRTVPYFLGKWLADLPRMVFFAFFFWVAFTSEYSLTGSYTDLYTIILLLYLFGFAMGYIASCLVSPNYIAVCGVFVALIFAVALSGTNPSMSDVRGKPEGQQNFWRLSGVRWSTEAFFINGQEYYDVLPHGAPFQGQEYVNVDYQLNKLGYGYDAFSQCVIALFFCGIGYSLLALIIMVITNLEKKK